MTYTCPMHPEVRQDGPGRCGECGMALVRESGDRRPETVHEGQGKHSGHSTQMFLRKFWICLVLTVPIVLLEFFEFPNSRALALVLGSIIFFYGGWVFLTGAGRELRGRMPGMMTLIALAIITAYAYSVYSVFFGDEHDLFWELATLITIMLLGHWLEMRAVSGTQSALKELSKLLPDVAEVVRDGKTQTVALSELKIGDVVLVRPGGKIPADGEVAEGNSDVDEAIVTGESRPVAKKAGDEVIAGTINSDGSLQIKITKIGEQTFLAGVQRLVREAQASKSRLQILSDKAAFALTIIAVVGGLITLFAWLSAGAGIAVTRMVAVLVIACPHALGLAIPLVASISTTLGARSGVLIRQRLALEAARKIDVVLFDKTGTLTKGEYGVEKIFNFQFSIFKVLQWAASVDAHSEHFVAKAIVAEARKQNLELLPVKDFQRLAGRGVRGMINGQEVLVGGEAILPKHSGIETSRGPRGRTIIYVIVGGAVVGSIALSDIIREESREAVAKLKALGIKTAMITGDSEDVAKWVAGELKIDEYFAKVLPEQKSAKVKLLQARGQRVAMVGDGVNDAPALTQANLGIAIGAGTNVAIESAGIILVKNDPRDIVKLIKLSLLTYRKMVQNLFWATGYNVIALPLAAGVLASRGIVLEPSVAAALMSVSTLIVAANAWILKKAVL